MSLSRLSALATQHRLFVCVSTDPADKRGWVVSAGPAIDSRTRIPEITVHHHTPEKAVEQAVRKLEEALG